MARPPRCLRLSAWAYRLLLAAYPASFRQKFGEEMAWVFDELAADAWQRRGVVGLTITWCRVLGDLARTAPREHWNLWKGGSEMKTVIAAILYVYVAIVIQGFVAITVMVIGVPLALMIGKYSVDRVTIAVAFCLAPFLTGVILTRVKPFFMPKLTGPLAAMMIVTPYAIAVGCPWWLCLGMVGAVGLLTFLGCFVATKASGRLDRIPIPASYWIGTLAALVCTFSVGLILWLVRSTNQLPVMHQALTFCLAALCLAAAATIANLVVFAVRAYKRTESINRA